MFDNLYIEELEQRDLLKKLAEIIDHSLKGSRTANECWRILRRPMLEARSPTLDEAESFQDAYGEFKFNPTGQDYPGLIVDLTKVETY